MTLNDFKSIEGDQRMGVGSLPVRLGVNGAARTACLMMLAPQAVVVALLLTWQTPWHALAVMALMLGQLPLMYRFIQDPIGKALMLSAAGVPLFVSGMMVSAWALRIGHGVPA
jgi:chlorophyll synthase